MVVPLFIVCLLHVGFDEYFTIKMHHAGNKTTTNYRDLLASKHYVNYFDFCDIDKLSMIELEHMCDELNILGHIPFMCKFYKMVNLVTLA